MRPVRLEMKAFGPYASGQVLDFSEIDGRSLFLIHGPTGSGKSTILDAICFALYGESSGGDRAVRHLRSDHASPSDATEVIFDFRLAGQEYRIQRKPEQEVPKKRGSGFVRVKPDAHLWKVRESDDGPKLDPVESGWSRVTDFVEGLVGFSKDQFRQVMMIPQGRFRELLTAGSGTRQAILEVLFQTGFYRSVEEALKTAAKTLADEAQELRRRQQAILEQSEVESGEQLLERAGSKATEIKELRAKVELAQRLDKEARERLEQSKKVAEKLKEIGLARAALKGLEEQGKRFNTERSVLGQARKAATLSSAALSLTKREKESRDAEKKCEKARARLKVATETQAQAAQAFRIEQDREPERQNAHIELTRLDELAGRMNELETAESELVVATREFKERDAQLLLANKNHEEAVGRLDETRQALHEAEKAASQVELAQARWKEVVRVLENRLKLDELTKNKLSVTKRLGIAQKELSEILDSLGRTDAEHAALEDGWFRGQAAILAKGLAPGEPCPVCGSPDHPAPAISEQDLPDQEQLKAKKAERDRLAEKRLTLERKKNDLEKSLSEVAATTRAIEQSMAEWSARSREEIETERDARAKELELSRKASKEAERLKEEVRAAELALSSVREQRPELEKALGQARDRLGRVQALAEERRSRVPEQLRARDALEKATQNAKITVTRLQDALDQARQANATANETVSASRAEVDAAQTAALEAGRRFLAEREEFTRRLREAGFPDEAAFNKARLSDDRIEEIERSIKTFDESTAAARNRLERAEQAASDTEAPDLEQLEADAKQKRNDRDRIVREQGALEKEIATLRKACEAYEAAAKKQAALEAEYSIVGRIAEVANGENRDRITFQRYVLATLLEDVLAAASDRLKRMSAGRFLLRRVEEHADRRTAGGLDLEVIDEYTGTSRPVSTLSGGESFLASLALALGLADVVQSYSGGIQLDTIFIDEGFGSLDPEALELAYRCLVDLQQSGRLVGIISHVPELKEQINVRLEVEQSRSGSTARFVVG
ncbi:MAG: SMC family ATPase [Thermodesulfobacteriota bacterium]